MTIFASRPIPTGPALLCGWGLAAATPAGASGCPVPSSGVAGAIGALAGVAGVSEAAASFMADPSGIAQFGYALTLSLGTGGLRGSPRRFRRRRRR